jgi:hypothetical protein
LMVWPKDESGTTRQHIDHDALRMQKETQVWLLAEKIYSN